MKVSTNVVKSSEDVDGCAHSAKFKQRSEGEAVKEFFSDLQNLYKLENSYPF